jgi:hypothetical protein
MQLGMIGLGRMGANMVRRLIMNGHQCVAYDRSAQAVNDLVKKKAVGAASLANLKLETRHSRLRDHELGGPSAKTFRSRSRDPRNVEGLSNQAVG